MHPFPLRNKQKGEKPAIVHPFETFSRFQDGKEEKACIIAGFLEFSHDLTEKACIFAGFSKSVRVAYGLCDGEFAAHAFGSAAFYGLLELEDDR
ncbi:hypothetical protein HQN90_18345 [Paenibacillus alba]|uniref:hypothetical protein n=1 Tax=Paenibacillus alba TaxID=1197127 RepID=UPI0015675C44|nr:hypothetical protein [Paenibacillus alba]NQX68088.1 hypothetical protein [Paenibacillus alba]